MRQLAILFLCLTLFACGEDDPEVALVVKNTRLLAGKENSFKSWKLEKFFVPNSNGNGTLVDIMLTADNCERDNFFKFNNSDIQEFSQNKGPLECYYNFSIIEEGKWYLTSEGLKLIVVVLANGVNNEYEAIFAYLPHPWDIITLTDDELVLHLSVDSDNFRIEFSAL